jgi:hypothetical protein
MRGRDGTPDGSTHRPPEVFDPLQYLSAFVRRSERLFMLVVGEPGAGKSSLLASLIPRLPDPKSFLAYTLPADPRESEGQAADASQEVALLLLHPNWVGQAPSPNPPEPASPPLLAFTAADRQPESSPSRRASDGFARISGPPGTSLLVDSWDRTSERNFRTLAARDAVVEKLTVSLASWTSTQTEILSGSQRYVLCVDSGRARRLLSLADLVVVLHEETAGGMRLRVASIPKVRGEPPAAADHLYTLTDGRFRFLSGLPPELSPEAGPVDPDPTPMEASIWPGSSAFAQAFGRLRFGGATGVMLSQNCPDSLPNVLAAPLAIHVLRSGGRVVWIPAPSVRPSRVLRLLAPFVPPDWMRERLRLLSASREERAQSELDRVLLPLRREPRGGDKLRTDDATGIGPHFPDAYRFLRDKPESALSVLILSLDGVRSTVTAAGSSFDNVTAPVVLGAYTRLTGFHLFGYGDATDPAVPYVRSAVDRLLEADIVHGRPVVAGIRPKTSAYAFDWTEPDGRYRLVPVT